MKPHAIAKVARLLNLSLVSLEILWWEELLTETDYCMRGLIVRTTHEGKLIHL